MSQVIKLMVFSVICLIASLAVTLTLAFISKPAYAAEKVTVSRVSQDVYEVFGEHRIIITMTCTELSNLEDVVITDNKLVDEIIFENGERCDIARIVYSN
jgi:hypothetical protein